MSIWGNVGRVIGLMEGRGRKKISIYQLVPLWGWRGLDWWLDRITPARV